MRANSIPRRAQTVQIERARSFLSRELNKHFTLGELVVRVLFVMSGFLITKLLLTELDTMRDPRRPLLPAVHVRIFPSYSVFILALVVADLARWIALAPERDSYVGAWRVAARCR
jgi:peptidoglycan/LPS O-acetylase OafA/YrhL